MATITNARLTLTKGAGPNWTATVRYTARFSQFEVNNFNFRDGFVLWEDDPFENDQITGVVGVSVFNPAALSVNRTMTAVVSGDDLDTEIGQEEIFAKVRLRNLELNVLYTGATDTVHVSP